MNTNVNKMIDNDLYCSFEDGYKQSRDDFTKDLLVNGSTVNGVDLNNVVQMFAAMQLQMSWMKRSIAELTDRNSKLENEVNELRKNGA